MKRIGQVVLHAGLVLAFCGSPRSALLFCVISCMLVLLKNVIPERHRHGYAIGSSVAIAATTLAFRGSFTDLGLTFLGVSYAFLRVVRALLVPERFTLGSFLRYYFFFPTFFSGPVLEPAQLTEERIDVAAGLRRILQGVVRIGGAQLLLGFIPLGIERQELFAIASWSRSAVWLGAFLSGVWPYLNFSGYSEIYIGAHLGRGYVYNLAWFGRPLAKDLMLLEGIWERRFDAVIFTVGEDTFSEEKAGIWIDKYRHISVNTPLFDRFLARIPEEERAPFERISARLEAADAANDGSWRRFTFEHFPTMHYRPFLQHLLVDRLAPDDVYSPMRWDERRTSRLRWFADKAPSPQRPGLLPDAIDEDQIALLESTIRLLSARGVETILYVEPYGPSDWPVKEDPQRRTGAAIARQIAERTGATVVDLTFSIPAADFMDSPAHYAPEANRRIGERIAEALEEVL